MGKYSLSTNAIGELESNRERLANFSCCDERFGAPDRGIKAEVLVETSYSRCCLRGSHHFISFTQGDSHGLLHRDMFSRFQGSDGHLLVPVFRRQNLYCLHLRISEKVFDRGVNAIDAPRPGFGLSEIAVKIAKRNQP